MKRVLALFGLVAMLASFGVSDVQAGVLRKSAKAVAKASSPVYKYSGAKAAVKYSGAGWLAKKIAKIAY